MTSRRRRTRTSITSVLVLVAIAVVGYGLHTAGIIAPDADAAPTAGPSTATPTTTVTTDPTVPPSPGGGADVDRARELLAALPVKGKAPATGYDRAADFGTPWLDVDHNGCDTRNDVLARDLTDISKRGPCTVTSGELVSPYTGGTIDFVRGNTTSTEVQIDHVVALENAWITGAQQLDQSEREALANDPENLFAVDQHSNAQKRSADAATWLPASTVFRCTYVEHQITVKTKYRLWVVPAEHDAMSRILERC